MTEIEARIYRSLSTRSRRSLLKTKYVIGKKRGKVKPYSPRHDLLKRLSNQFGITTEEALKVLTLIRRRLLRTAGLEI